MNSEFARALQLAAAAAELPPTEVESFISEHCPDAALAERVRDLLAGVDGAGEKESTSQWTHSDQSDSDGFALTVELPSADRPVDLIDACAGKMSGKVLAAGNSEEPAEPNDPWATVGFNPGRFPEHDQDPFFVHREGGDETLTSEQQGSIQEICDRLAEAWSRDEVPSLRDFVPNTGSQSYLVSVVQKLVEVDLFYRRKRMEEVDESVYLSSLPEYQDVVKSVFDATVKHSKESTPRRQSKWNQNRQWTFDRQTDVSERYQLLEPHARGGLGEVYRAKDRELHRIVALKTIRSQYVAGKENRERFVFEAEITGSLEHPGIVPVHSLGKFGEDSPYYAMRFIRGESLRDAVRQFHERHPHPGRSVFLEREFRQFLGQLVDCCNAMHYAHERGVLHRDLKPDNVMIGSYGETLVVDWGLAKMITDSDGGHPMDDSQLSAIASGSETSNGSVVGTPTFMSPEQALGLNDSLLPASDVYSLGAILFFIVSGKPPVEGRTAREIVLRVQRNELRELLDIVPTAPGPLRSICLRAMHSEPSQRYQSARELADDVDRWLSDEQVSAHAQTETRFEKAGRLLRRYRGWTVSGGVALVAIAVVATSAAILISRARTRESIAKVQAQQRRAEAVKFYRNSISAIDTLVEGTDQFEDVPGTQSLRRELLATADGFFSRLADSTPDDPELQLERAKAKIKAGDIAKRQQDAPGARTRYDEAAELLDRQIADEALMRQYVLEQQRVFLRQAELAADQADYVTAVKNYNHVIDNLRFSIKTPDDRAAARQVAAAHSNLAEIYREQAKREPAENQFLAAMAQWALLADGGELTDRLARAKTETLYARFVRAGGDRESALDLFRAAAKRLRALNDLQPANRDVLVALADTLLSESELLRELGAQTDLFRRLEEAAGYYRLLSEAMPDVPEYAEKHCASLVNAGLVLVDGERCRDAVAVLKDAERVATGLMTIFGADPKYENLLATSLDGLALSYLYLGQIPEAKAASVESVVTYLELCQLYDNPAKFVKRLGVARSHHARIVAAEGHGVETEDELGAETQFELSLGDLDFLTGEARDLEYKDLVARVHYHYGLFLDDQNDARSTEQLESARYLWFDMGMGRSADATERLAWLLLIHPDEQKRDLAAAVKLAASALAISPQNAKFQSTLALAYLLQGDAVRAAGVIKVDAGQSNSWLGRVELVRGLIESRTGRSESAAAALDAGHAWYADQAPKHPDYKQLRLLIESETP